MLDKQLKDIIELDVISYWPPGIGCYVLLLAIVIIIYVIVMLVRKYLAYQDSWQKSVQTNLTIADKLYASDPQQAVSILSSCLRWMALQISSREESAGLVTQDWLTWLQQHDPNNFAWHQHAELLCRSAYANNVVVNQQSFIQVLAAARKWISKC